MKAYWVYMMANWTNGVLYIGVTNNLERRIAEHKTKSLKGFSEKYNVNKLVYCEEFKDVKEALEREKQLKKWNRKKKEGLVETINPSWNDLANGL